MVLFYVVFVEIKLRLSKTNDVKDDHSQSLINRSLVSNSKINHKLIIRLLIVNQYAK